ncbi:NAD(P)H-dependent oxidoreductase subunit E [Puniceicoccales bacterium CK1056]|uniref:NAD(P)H-dependent oxidoreductase subunit E n=1 Tax=Oceanipulchritudo coccoides TaxID=2706888 RepID=A0A6B2M598_9BACT|nr:NAD(P)H-dependent oxidoreductase subunit E [Oceanipulchritudo coccoides]NDV63566.1 NAD(P)H-dependent oxidoreductase subunit E [Oceanipulchritudo coccoides]
MPVQDAAPIEEPLITNEPSEESLLCELDEIIEQYAGKPGSLIPILQMAQSLFGYLPDSVIRRVAEKLEKPLSEVAGVIGFYSFFSRTPQGRHQMRVCLGTACYVRGGKEVLGALKKELGIDIGESTPDRCYSLEVGRCFGACGLAPVLMADVDVHQRVKPSKIGEILKKYEDDERETGKGA